MRAIRAAFVTSALMLGQSAFGVPPTPPPTHLQPPAVDISGTWTITGDISVTCRFTQVENSVSARCRGFGGIGFPHGVISGRNVDLWSDWYDPGAKKTIEFSLKGTVTDRDIVGTLEVNAVAHTFRAGRKPDGT